MNMFMLFIMLLSRGAAQQPADSLMDSVTVYARSTNQSKLMLIAPPLGAELGALASIPIAWVAGWMATGFKVETEFTSCGMPSGCNCVISYPVFWSVFGLGTACSGISAGCIANRLGEKMDLRQARAEYLAVLAQRINRPGKLSFSHIWYLGAGGVEYGYNMGRMTVGRISYVYAPAFIGFGIEGPSYFPADEKWQPPMLNLYIMPYRASYRIGQTDFLRNMYVFFGFRPGRSDSTSRKISFNAGLGFSAGSLITVKIGAAQNLSDTLQAEFDPNFYASVEVEWGSWFYTQKFRPSSR